MPTAAVRNGLYWSTRTKTFHYLVRIGGRNHQGDTGHPKRGPALNFLAKYRTSVAETVEKQGAPVPKTAPTLAQALAQWAAAEAGSFTEKHIHERVGTLRRHCADVLDLQLDRLDTAKIDGLRSAYLGGEWKGHNWHSDLRPRTPGGWNRVRRHLYALVNWCKDREMLASCPFKAKPIKVQETMPPTLWPEKTAEFLEAVEGVTRGQDVRTAIRLMVQLGLRENEALGARWEGVDERQGTYCPDRTKDREVREIALPPGLLAYLRSHHVEAKMGLIMDGGGVPHISGYTREAVVKAGLALGIQGLHPHSLRATFATAHWEAGTPLGQITAMLGHKDPSTTMKYIRQRQRDATEAQAKVAAAMGLVAAIP